MRSLSSVSYADGSEGKALHDHDCHQMLYIVQGKIAVTVDGRQFQAGAGDLLLFSRLEQHSVTVLQSPYRRYTLIVSGSDALLERSTYLGNRLSLPAGVLDALLAEMTKEHSGNLPYREEMLENLYARFHLLLCRFAPKEVFQKENELVAAIRRRLEREYAQSLRLCDLAAEYHMSVSRLSHLFRSVTGRSILNYRDACRLSAAKRLLTQTALPIGNILDVCGYTDASNFSRSFKAATGMTPTQFREKFA